jgi:hypothetical protein
MRAAEVSCLAVKVVDPDGDYIGIDVRVSNDRYAGTVFVYAGLDEPVAIAEALAGFPACVGEERSVYLGSRDEKIAGGYCHLHFASTGSVGYVKLTATLEDDRKRHRGEKATLSIDGLTPSDIDRFVEDLRRVGRERRGEAVLAALRS